MEDQFKESVVDIHKSKAVICPHCLESIRLTFRAEIVSARKDIPTAGTGTWRDSVLPDEAAMIEEARAQGLLGAFDAACRERHTACGSAPPVNQVELAFLAWLRLLRPRTVPPFALTEFIKLHPEKRISFYAANGIIAVQADSKVVHVVPQEYVAGVKLRGIDGSGQRSVGLLADPSTLTAWVKTRHGYVAGGSLMLDEMRRRSLGEWVIGAAKRKA